MPSYLVADGGGVKTEWLEGVRSIGLTAGASAPDVLVDDVIATLRRFGPVEISTLSGVEENVQFKLPPELAPSRAE